MDGSGRRSGGGIADGSTTTAAVASAPPAAGNGGDGGGPSDDARDLSINTLNDAKMATTADAKVKRKKEREKD